MSLEDYERYSCFDRKVIGDQEYPENACFQLLNEAAQRRRLLVAGKVNPAIQIPLSHVKGVANPEKPLGYEIGRTEMDYLNECGVSTPLSPPYFQQPFWDSLIISYLLNATVCYVDTLSGITLHSRNIELLQRHFPEASEELPAFRDFLLENMDFQIASGEVRSFCFGSNSAQPEKSVVSTLQTICPVCLVQGYLQSMITRLLQQRARIFYQTPGAAIAHYIVSLESNFLMKSKDFSPDVYRKIAWDGVSPKLHLPVYQITGTGGLKISEFSVFGICDIDWL